MGWGAFDSRSITPCWNALAMNSTSVAKVNEGRCQHEMKTRLHYIAAGSHYLVFGKMNSNISAAAQTNISDYISLCLHSYLRI